MKSPSSKKYLLVLLFAAFLIILSACKPSASAPSASTNSTTSEEEQSEESAASSEEIDENIPEIEWYTPSTEILSEWAVRLAADNPFRVSLTQRNQSNDAQNILFIYTKAHPLFDNGVEKVLSVFQDKAIPLNATIILAESDEAAFNAISYATANDIDLIFAMGSSTTAFIHENYSNGSIPVVTVLSKDPVLLGQVDDYVSGSGTNIAYTSVGMPVELQVNYFRALVPNLQNIIILYEGDNASTVATQVDPLDVYAKETGLNLLHVATETTEEEDGVANQLKEKIPGAISALNKIDPNGEKTIILVTGSASIVSAFDTVNTLAGNIPVVSLFPELVQEGDVSAVLSVGVSFDSNAILSGLYGARILEDRVSPGEMPVGVISPPDVAVSFAIAREIGLKIPFAFFESAAFVYDADGTLVRDKGQLVEQP